MNTKEKIYRGILGYVAEKIKNLNAETYVHYLWQRAMNNKQNMPWALEHIVRDAQDDFCRDNNITDNELYEQGLFIDTVIVIAEALDMLDEGDRIETYFVNK